MDALLRAAHEDEDEAVTSTGGAASAPFPKSASQYGIQPGELTVSSPISAVDVKIVCLCVCLCVCVCVCVCVCDLFALQ